MKQKQILLAFCLTIFTLVVLGQTNIDIIKMKDGTTYSGQYMSKDDSTITFRTGENFAEYKVIKIQMADIDKMTLHLGEGRKKTELVNTFSNFKSEVKEPIKVDIKDTGFHLKRAGRFGITGVSFLVVGSIFEAVGIVKGIPGLTYTGVAMSGLGGIFLIVPFGQMIRAGNKYPKPKE